MARHLTLGIFQKVTADSMSGALWRHPDNTSLSYTSLDYWVSLVRQFEEMKLDFLFLADGYGLPMVDGKVPEVAAREGIFTGDPLSLMSALALSSTHIGLVATASTTFETPYANARRFSTLDHFSKGRVGWNVVTSASAASAAAMFGTEMVPHDQRYDMADEFLDLSFQFWEGSWAEGAVLRDKARAIYADPAGMHQHDLTGKFYRSRGVFPVEPSPQRTPVLFQAGSSPRGRRFAGRTAECVFLQGTTVPEVSRAVDDVRRQAADAGRDPADIKIIVGLTIITARSTQLAQAKYRDFAEFTSDEAAASRYAYNTGINLLALDPGKPLPADLQAEQGRSNVDRYRGPNAPTVRQILDEFKIRGLRGLVLVGTPQDVVGELERYVEQTGVDGFLIEPCIVPGSYEDLAELILPLLRKRGLAPGDYHGATLRERLFGDGNRLLPGRHPAARFRPAPLAVAEHG